MVWVKVMLRFGVGLRLVVEVVTRACSLGMVLLRKYIWVKV